MSRLRHTARDYWILAVLVLVFLAAPQFLNQFQISLAISILLWALLGNAWNIMGGYAGQFSFGHAMFYGIGAYTSTVLLVNFYVSPWIGMIAGAALAGLFGAVVGFLLFRFGVRGHFFALGTFAIAELLRLLASEWEYINSSIGIHLPLVRGDDWGRIQFESTPAYYFYVILILFAASMLITIWLVRRRIGFYFQAIREDEVAAAALGVDPLRTKILAVVISGALTAIGGSFFAHYFLFVDPMLAFGASISVQILLRPIVGGVGTIWGPLLGAILLTPLAEFTRALVRNPPPMLDFLQGRAGVDLMIYGLLLILVILFIPDGLMGVIQRIWRRVKGGHDGTFA